MSITKMTATSSDTRVAAAQQAPHPVRSKLEAVMLMWGLSGLLLYVKHGMWALADFHAFGFALALFGFLAALLSNRGWVERGPYRTVQAFLLPALVCAAFLGYLYSVQELPFLQTPIVDRLEPIVIVDGPYIIGDPPISKARSRRAPIVSTPLIRHPAERPTVPVIRLEKLSRSIQVCMLTSLNGMRPPDDLEVLFLVSPTGKALEAHVYPAEFQGSTVEKCLQDRIEHSQFQSLQRTSPTWYSYKLGL